MKVKVINTVSMKLMARIAETLPSSFTYIEAIMSVEIKFTTILINQITTGFLNPL
jgi:hypothetical protein